MIAALLLCLSLNANAQDASPQYPTHSWTWNVDVKDPDAIKPFIGREVVDGQWKAGAAWSPISVYRVSEADAAARRWLTAGVFVVTNTEKANATFGPKIGLDILSYTSQPRLAGAANYATKWWKPSGLLSITASVDLWGGWTPVHTSDVKHNYAGGFGFSLSGRWGAQGAMDAANAIIKGGL